MESEVLKKFNNELSTLNDGKNLSKTKIQDITKAAIKAKANYKNVVFNIERLMAKSKPEQRISALYVIDSIIRASKHQLKEKDVFGPRFMKQFDRILDHMLKCGQKEKYKTIRTINLWLSNKVFAEKDLQPFRERCKKAGLAIEYEQVERAVKGSKADMSIYSGAYKKKEKTSRRSKALDDGLLGAGPSSTLPLPDIPTFALSEEILDGTISEREMMELVQKFGIDRGGLLAKNRELLQKTLRVFIATLQPKIAEAQSGNKKNDGNSIQNVLTKDFEYSDDEEEKEKDIQEEEQKKLTHDEVLELAQSMINIPTVVAQLHEVLNPVALAPIVPLIKEEVPTSLGAFTAGPPPNLLGIPQLPGFPGLTGLSTAEMLRVQNTQNLILQQRAAQALLQSVPVSGQHNLLLLGNQLLNPFGIPAGMNPLLPPPNQELAQQQQQMLLNGMEQKMEAEVNSEEVAKQKQKESRERRKMGLPSIKSGKTIVASRTLWLKKIPTNVTENELKQAVESCGEATRVKIIGNRACAFITMDTRRAANEVIQKLREVTVAKKQVKVYWARSPGMDSDVYTEMWEPDRGVLEIPYEKLPSDLAPLCEGAVLDVESLPEGKRAAYNEKGEAVLTTPQKQANSAPPPPVPQPPPPLGFPFPVGLGQLPPGFNGGKPAPPGMHPLLNMTVPPPPGMSAFPPAPPPPGVGPPGGGPPLGFDPNKPPPMFQPPRFHGPPGVPAGGHPPPPFGRGNGAMPPFGRGGGPPPMGFRGTGGGPPPPHHFDARRGGMMPRPEMNMHRPEGRGRLMDQSEMWNRERERSGQSDRRRRDENPRRRSRWEDDDRNSSPRNGSSRNGSPRYRRRSPERRPRRSPSNEQWGEPEVKRSSADENEIVSSTTLDELKPKDGAPVAEVVVPKVEDPHEDKTDDVPMDLE